MNPHIPVVRSLAVGLLALGLTSAAEAAPLLVRVTIENLAPANSVSFAPLRVGFNNGTFDAFDINTPAGAAIISVAEGGSGADWFPAFAAADPTAVLGTVGGALLPGATASADFVVDPSINQYFTFASMVIPSNDFFIGNDSPTAFRVFDNSGNVLIHTINQSGADIWDAGSEAFDPLNAAFLAIGNNDLRTPQNGSVAFDFAELAGFNGLTTAAGYTFDSQLMGTTPVYRISLEAVPVPEPSAWLMLMSSLGAATVARVRQIRRR
ncbi:spondin domain-containing protein [Luteitalea sp.]|uniref:spondin domain-containing protein n=1 Tax=Luteitalea sp. TaxID=2004800 RepID=UPI0025C61203|nr:spondin domain-containing protein [Luteitalea sp.]